LDGIEESTVFIERKLKRNLKLEKKNLMKRGMKKGKLLLISR